MIRCIKQNDAPDAVESNAAGLCALPQIREVVYQVPRLLVTRAIETGPFSGRGKRKRKKDAEEEHAKQQLYEQLSKYYQRPTAAGHWAPQEVLSNCKHKRFGRAGDISFTHFLSVVRDLEAHPELLLRGDKSTPGASTSMTEAGPGSK